MDGIRAGCGIEAPVLRGGEDGEVGGFVGGGEGWGNEGVGGLVSCFPRRSSCEDGRLFLRVGAVWLASQKQSALVQR